MPFGGVDFLGLGENLGSDGVFETFHVDVLVIGQPPDRCFERVGAGATAFDHPFENSGVLAVAGPEEFAFGAFAEPVHMKNAGHIFDEFPHLEPVGEVVAHVVTAER